MCQRKATESFVEILIFVIKIKRLRGYQVIRKSGNQGAGYQIIRISENSCRPDALIP
jgi:hypothetical protein